jgi:hypothetical protein
MYKWWKLSTKQEVRFSLLDHWSYLCFPYLWGYRTKDLWRNAWYQTEVVSILNGWSLIEKLWSTKILVLRKSLCVISDPWCFDITILTYLLTYLLTHSLTHSLHGAGYYCCHSACQKISCFLMEPEGSLPCSHKHSTGSYPEPAESNLLHRSLSL